MKLKYELMSREIMGEYALIPVGDSAIAMGGMMITNEVGAFLCEMLQVEMTKDELISALRGEFDVDQATANQDVSAFLEQLEGWDLLI
ncbi:MAG: PqqD family protein [Ruminococcaceae bacterium]|nr:PqqD family protein [Oscillospiraceae bacterium]